MERENFHFQRFNMREPDYQETIAEIRRCARLCWQINQTGSLSEELRGYLKALFASPLDSSSNIFPPLQIDMGTNVHIGKRVFIVNTL